MTVCLGFAYLDGYLKCNHFMDPREDGGTLQSLTCSLLGSVMAAGVIKLGTDRKQCVDDQQTDQARTVLCIACKQCFRWQSDRARHKCMVDKQWPVREQPGQVQCHSCECWFRSKGGLAVHKCRMNNPLTQTSFDVDLKQHKCLSERAKPISEQCEAVQGVHCQRWIKSAGGLAVHQRKCNSSA